MEVEQLPLFDARFSQLDAEVGIGRASFPERRRALLEEAKQEAMRLAADRYDRCLTADDLVEWYSVHRLINLPAKLGNAMGSIFKGADWIFTGRYILSERVSRHRNTIRVWRLR